MATGRAVSPGVRAGWQNFKAQLHVHHTVEDDDLWPRLYRAVNDRPEDVAIDTLIGALDAHLEHEEKSALPLIQAVLTPADWRAFGSAMRRRQGLKGAAVYFPWILDGATPADRDRCFSALPTALQVINRLFWEPRYRRMGLWGV
jgi:hypothetical protein